MGDMVEFPSNGGTGGGYLAAANEGAGLGVVVVQEWEGLFDHIVDVCDRLAAEGFTALAPDLYHRRTAPDRQPDHAADALWPWTSNGRHPTSPAPSTTSRATTPSAATGWPWWASA